MEKQTKVENKIVLINGEELIFTDKMSIDDINDLCQTSENNQLIHFYNVNKKTRFLVPLKNILYIEIPKIDD